MEGTRKDLPDAKATPRGESTTCSGRRELFGKALGEDGPMERFEGGAKALRLCDWAQNYMKTKVYRGLP